MRWWCGNIAGWRCAYPAYVYAAGVSFVCRPDKRSAIRRTLAEDAQKKPRGSGAKIRHSRFPAREVTSDSGQRVDGLADEGFQQTKRFFHSLFANHERPQFLAFVVALRQHTVGAGFNNPLQILAAGFAR